MKEQSAGRKRSVLEFVTEDIERFRQHGVDEHWLTYLTAAGQMADEYLTTIETLPAMRTRRRVARRGWYRIEQLLAIEVKILSQAGVSNRRLNELRRAISKLDACLDVCRGAARRAAGDLDAA